jgi:hypothetical protein
MNDNELKSFNHYTCAKENENYRRRKSILAAISRAGCNKKERQTPDGTTCDHREKAAQGERDKGRE